VKDHGRFARHGGKGDHRFVLVIEDEEFLRGEPFRDVIIFLPEDEHRTQENESQTEKEYGRQKNVFSDPILLLQAGQFFRKKVEVRGGIPRRVSLFVRHLLHSFPNTTVRRRFRFLAITLYTFFTVVIPMSLPSRRRHVIAGIEEKGNAERGL
jgi:hypothetical protein